MNEPRLAAESCKYNDSLRARRREARPIPEMKPSVSVASPEKLFTVRCGFGSRRVTVGETVIPFPPVARVLTASFTAAIAILGSVASPARSASWSLQEAAAPYKGLTINVVGLDRPSYVAEKQLIPQFEKLTGINVKMTTYPYESTLKAETLNFVSKAISTTGSSATSSGSARSQRRSGSCRWRPLRRIRSSPIRRWT